MKLGQLSLFQGLGVLIPAGLDVDLNSRESTLDAAHRKAFDVMSYYHGNESGQTPGILPGPPPLGDYYWWMGGALWGLMIDYWHYTGDTAYNDVVQTALLFQAGPDRNYMVPNWTASLGNDDQGFWGMSAMLAAEVNFQNPPPDQPSWLALAQAVFNTQAAPDRHDNACGGGLRWQVPYVNNGYNYKNSIANGCFFNLGARLARYTLNQSYADHAAATWDWMEGVGLLDDKGNIYDGAHVESNCTDINRAQFSYNAAVFMQGAAFMYNFTNGSDLWRERIDRLLNQTILTFFINGTATEISCETPERMTCTTDMFSFKGYLHRWLAVVAQLAPFTRARITPVLRSSAAAAVAQCTGGESGRTCGFRWARGAGGAPDDVTGAGQEMNVLGALLSLLAVREDGVEAKAPVTNKTGGTSRGDPGAGAATWHVGQPREMGRLRGEDRSGAAILTGSMVVLGSAAFVWICSPLSEGPSSS